VYPDGRAGITNLCVANQQSLNASVGLTWRSCILWGRHVKYDLVPLGPGPWTTDGGFVHRWDRGHAPSALVLQAA